MLRPGFLLRCRPRHASAVGYLAGGGHIIFVANLVLVERDALTPARLLACTVPYLQSRLQTLPRLPCESPAGERHPHSFCRRNDNLRGPATPQSHPGSQCTQMRRRLRSGWMQVASCAPFSLLTQSLGFTVRGIRAFSTKPSDISMTLSPR